MRYTALAHLILVDLITLMKFGETPHYAAFSSLPPLPAPYVQIFSPSSCITIKSQNVESLTSDN